MPDANQAKVEADAIRNLTRLVEQARGGDESVLPQLRRAMDEHREIWTHFGNLSNHVEMEWIKLLSGSDVAIRESLLRQSQAMRAELEGSSPSRLERLLCDAVVISWLESQYFSIVLVTSGDRGSPRQIESLHLRRDSAHRRHLLAVKALAETRKLLGLSAADTSISRIDGRMISRATIYVAPDSPTYVPGPKLQRKQVKKKRPR